MLVILEKVSIDFKISFYWVVIRKIVQTIFLWTYAQIEVQQLATEDVLVSVPAGINI